MSSSLLQSIKRDAKKSGGNKAKFMYFREGNKIRVRFLTDMEEGMEITFHDSFEQSINVPCQSHFGRDCPYCDRDDVRTRSQYIWSVWNYDAKEVQLFMFPMNNCSPVPSLVAFYESYGTLTDRDYVISVSGKMQNKTFAVVPQDKVKFRNDKAKPYTENQILKMLDKAWPCEESGDDDDDEDEKPIKKKKKPNTKKASDDVDTEDDYDDSWDDEDETKTKDYEDMSPKELYSECKKRKLDVQPKKPAKYYIKQLQDDDEAHEDWDDEDDDWEDDDE